MEPEYEEQEEREFDVGADDETPEVPEQEADEELVVEDADESEAEAAAEPEPEREPEQAEEKPKRAGRLQQRLENLARRAAEAEAALERERTQRVSYEQQLAAERVAQVGQMETALKAELASAKRELIDAKTTGDYSAEVEATTKIAKLTADISAVEAYRAQAPQPRQQQQQAEQPRPQAPQQAQVAPDTAAWIAANPWFVPNSPDYDEELAAEAQHFARKMEIRLKREGKADQIGSREYFTIIDEHLRGEFPDAFEDAPKSNGKAKTPPMRSDNSVAPVARQTAPLQPKQKAGRVVKLTSEQKHFAEQMRPNLPREKAWAEYAKWM
jgi:hypothetical protein